MADGENPYNGVLDKLKARAERLREEEVAGLMPEVSEVLKASAGPGSRAMSVSDRLSRKFGFGDQPQRRRALYFRLEELTSRHGDKVLKLISAAVAQAGTAGNPGRYFCVAVTRMLRESNLWGAEGSW